MEDMGNKGILSMEILNLKKSLMLASADVELYCKDYDDPDVLATM